MIIEIHGGDRTYVLLSSKDKRFAEAWGELVRIPSTMFYKNLSEIAAWVNNDLEEECLFEVV